jgi:hypothetical protein
LPTVSSSLPRSLAACVTLEERLLPPPYDQPSITSGHRPRP